MYIVIRVVKRQNLHIWEPSTWIQFADVTQDESDIFRHKSIEHLLSCGSTSWSWRHDELREKAGIQLGDSV